MTSARRDDPRLLALGTAVPGPSMTQEQALELACSLRGADERERRLMRALYRGTRIATRHACLGDARHPLDRALRGRPSGPATSPTTAERMEVHAREAPALAARAARAALEAPGAPPAGSVTHLIVATCTGFAAPGLDVLLARELGLRRDAARVVVGFQGCQAGLTSLRVAETACRADPSATALVACVELCTLHLQESGTEDDALAAALFADGASAAIVGGASVPARAPHFEIARCATRLHDDSLDHMTWRIGDHGFVLSLSSYLPRVLASDVRPFLAEDLGVTAGEAQHAAWAVHPGGAAILEALARSLELPDGALDASWSVLARHGNMSSATIGFVLAEHLARGTTGDLVALAFGPGLTIEGARLVART